VDPASATTALHSVGVSGNTTKICTYTGAPSGIQNFNNTSCDSQTGSGVVEVTRENVDQFNNRFFCGVSFSETTSPPARPSGWEFFQNWTVSVPPGPVSAPYPHSGELPVACAGSIDWSCRNAISGPPETSPAVGRSCKSSIILMPGGIYATSDSGLIQPAVIYQQELVTLGATSNWFNGAPPVRSFQSSKRQGNGVGCTNNAPFCQSVGSLQQCRARQRGYGVY
jgi:hypothetical protein